MNDFTLKAIPTFRITNYDKAIDFYIKSMGFKIDWEHRFKPNEPVYMQVSNNGLILHLSENKRFKTGVIIFVETQAIEKFHQSLINGINDEKIPEITTTNWNTKQLEIQDPFGNLLRFNEN